MTELALARMRVRAAAGQHAAALEDWYEAVGRPVQGVPRASWIDSQLVAADALRATGDATSARALAAEAVSIARRWGTPGAIGEALHGRARLEADPIELLREALALLDDAPAPLVRARALIDLGAALRRRGDRRASRPPCAKRCA